MTTSTLSNGFKTGLGATFRTDQWWIEPVWTGVVFMIVRRLHDVGGAAGRPLLRGAVPVAVLLAGAVRRSERARRGAGRARLVRRSGRRGGRAFLPCSPAILILVVPGLLPLHLLLLPQGVLPRRSSGSPPGCAVGAVAASASTAARPGCSSFQNLHRYALYFALAVHRRSSTTTRSSRSSRTASSASASARIVLLDQRRRCSPATRSAATRSAT